MLGTDEIGGRSPGRCDDGYWWTAPSCRSNTTECVPWVTGGFGWGIEEYMQKSTIFQIPMAIGVALSWATYTEFPFWHPKSHFYWWIPDPTFLELQPLQMIFPPHDRIAYSKGDLTGINESVKGSATPISSPAQISGPQRGPKTKSSASGIIQIL